jgi:hypothetical protein
LWLSDSRIGWLVIGVLNIFARQRDVQQNWQNTNYQAKHCGNYQMHWFADGWEN